MSHKYHTVRIIVCIVGRQYVRIFAYENTIFVLLLQRRQHGHQKHNRLQGKDKIAKTEGCEKIEISMQHALTMMNIMMKQPIRNILFE